MAKKKRKARVLWALERTTSLICDRDGLVVGLCFSTKSLAIEANKWAHGRVVKFKEVLDA